MQARVASHAPNQRPSVHTRQAHVGHDEIGRMAEGPPIRLDAVARLFHRVRAPVEQHPIQPAGVLIGIDEQDCGFERAAMQHHPRYG